MAKIIFGDELINKNINLVQAKYIIDMNNWFKSIYEFKNGFLNIKNSDNKDFISYFSLEHSSYCDHSLVHS